MVTYMEIPHPMGGMLWKGHDLAGDDAGYRGRIHIPSLWEVKNGKLVSLT